MVMALTVIEPELLLFVSVMFWVLLAPTLTLPKLSIDALAVSCPGGTLTVKVAALLVTLPAVLLAITVNCEPLSEVVVTGVV
jgi:hypothetical protein